MAIDAIDAIDESQVEYNQTRSSEIGGDNEYQVITGSHARNFMVNDHRLNSQQGFSNNKVCTTKYTWWTFIPLNLFQQFSKFANLYFLTLCVLQVSSYAFSEITTITI